MLDMQLGMLDMMALLGHRSYYKTLANCEDYWHKYQSKRAQHLKNHQCSIVGDRYCNFLATSVSITKAVKQEEC